MIHLSQSQFDLLKKIIANALDAKIALNVGRLLNHEAAIDEALECFKTLESDSEELCRSIMYKNLDHRPDTQT